MKEQAEPGLGDARPLRRFLRRALRCYVAIEGSTVVLAHFVKVYAPESGWSERMIARIAAELEFVDVHGKAMSILIVPVAGPLAIELAKLLKPIAGVEFQGSPP